MVKRSRSRGRLQARAESSYVTRRLLMPVQAFIQVEGRSGILLLGAALAALAWANSPWADSYFALRERVITVDLGFHVISQDLQQWINDAFMAVFFFVVGLEIKREILTGALADPRRATLPLAAALGGMLLPALLYLAINPHGEASRGWGIPIATDIAFAVGVLTLLGRRVPAELRTLLLALAIADDIGAIVVIALVYTEALSLQAVWTALLLIGVILVLRLTGIRNVLVYGLAAVLFWGAVHASGIHATISGVVLAALTPTRPPLSTGGFARSMQRLLARFRDAVDRAREEEAEVVLGEMEEVTRGTEAPLDRLERIFHPWSSYVILPVFALANAGVSLSGAMLKEAAVSPVTWGVLAGLLVGKPLGVVGFAWAAVRLRLAALPRSVGWQHVFAMGLLAGIGFTVSLFITGLAFAGERLLVEAKIGILAGSIIAAVSGAYVFLWLVPRVRRSAGERP